MCVRVAFLWAFSLSLLAPTSTDTMRDDRCVCQAVDPWCTVCDSTCTKQCGNSARSEILGALTEREQCTKKRKQCTSNYTGSLYY